MADQTAIVDYYVNRLIAQYVTMPKARGTIAAYVRQALIDGLYDELQNAFTLSTAVGPQLDILGKYIGLSRNIGVVVDDTPYFGFQSSNSDTGNLNGFTDSTDAGVNAQAIFYQTSFTNTVNTALTDTSYRFMLVLKIALNQSDGTLASIQDFLHTYLDGFVALVDNADMTMTYTFTEKVPAGLNAATIAAYLPRPMGVGVNFVTLDATASPTTLSHTNQSPIPNPIVISGNCTATPVNGVGPYTYLWSNLSQSWSGEPPLSVDATAPFSSVTTFKATFAAPLSPVSSKTSVSTWQCTVTDSRGLIALSDIVTVSLTYRSPP
jgi:hypothetical protein